MKNIKAGDKFVALGDETQGIALMKAEGFLEMAEMIKNSRSDVDNSR